MAASWRTRSCTAPYSLIGAEPRSRQAFPSLASAPEDKRIDVGRIGTFGVAIRDAFRMIHEMPGGPMNERVTARAWQLRSTGPRHELSTKPPRHNESRDHNHTLSPRRPDFGMLARNLPIKRLLAHRTADSIR